MVMSLKCSCANRVELFFFFLVLVGKTGSLAFSRSLTSSIVAFWVSLYRLQVWRVIAHSSVASTNNLQLVLPATISLDCKPWLAAPSYCSLRCLIYLSWQFSVFVQVFCSLLVTCCAVPWHWQLAATEQTTFDTMVETCEISWCLRPSQRVGSKQGR